MAMRTILLAAWIYGAVGCACSEPNVGCDAAACEDDAGTSEGDDGGGVDAAIPDTGTADSGTPPTDGSRAEFCDGRGPAIEVPGGDGEAECTGSIARRTFRYALCTCEDASFVGRFSTVSFDSDDGTEETESGAAVGVNGGLDQGGGLDVGGSLTATGAEGLSLIGSDIAVHGDLSVDADLSVTGSADVDRDVVHAGEVTTIGTLNIGGTQRMVSSVPDPCACDDEDLLDVAAAVSAAETDNHNADIDLSPDTFEDLVGTNARDLPCGRLYLTGIGGVGSLTLRVDGRTALFIDGDLTTQGSLTVELGPEGELDVFIDGRLSLTGPTQLGDPARPRATRIYVSGTDDVDLTGGGDFVGNLYAPRALVRATGTFNIYGAVFARDFEATGSATVHYDRAIVREGEDCVPPPDECMECGDCAGGLACREASCVACTSDADCCAPLVCDSATGACGPLLI